MRFLLRVVPKDPGRTVFLATAKGIAKSIGVRVTHPRWSSYGALEIDVFASALDFELFRSAMEPLAAVEFARNLDEAPPFKPKEEIIRESVGYFNAERYWECHEALEAVWRPAKGKEKLLLQSIILVCAAQVHEQRGEREVALGIYRRALPQVSWDEARYHGIDVARLRKHVEAALESGEPRPFKI